MPDESPTPGVLPVNQGEVLAGKYRVDSVLGIGGMGVVVAATHLQLAQRVALKFMLPEGLRHPALVERFLREARAAVRLKSDHVARVLDVGTLASGSPYMVMEFLEGSDLGTIVEQRGPVSIDVAVDCVLQACDAVAEAHSLGIIHRDLKPRNLFMTQRNDGRALVKVLDFGISKDRTGADLGLTRTTEVIGSPNYMSPEQLKSTKLADERSDIWALGVILYELLTGAVPFVAESITQLTAMVLTEPPRPIALLRPEIPRDLGRVVDRCLEKDPEKRFASVAELAAALEKFAPHDTRELANRIARIASGTRVSGSPAAVSARFAVAGSTSVSWTEKTELATTKRKTVALVAAVVATMVAAGVVGAVAFTKLGRGTSTSGGQAAATSGGAATGAGMVAQSTSIAPAVTLSGLPPTPAPASASASVALPAPAAPTASAAKPGPRTVVGSGPQNTNVTKPEPGTAASANEAPRYRTSW